MELYNGTTNRAFEEENNTQNHVIFGMTQVKKKVCLSAPTAISVRNACKSYGKGPLVLNNLSLTIKKGTIYSLLGSSGCGKTTLLSCIVGLRKLNSGEILVFGKPPGNKGCGVPGKLVGYMPQELALYNDFSIKESLHYFGAIYNMSSNDIIKSQDFLVDFLDLPSVDRSIKTLSGGQRRRVSLALALVHSPKLLILDEPTVGVDPLLRENIWNHLLKIVANHETTVILTTHYTEEARPSDTVGLMRDGRLIAEQNPEQLILTYGTSYLEDIVLKLCRNDDMNVNNQNELSDMQALVETGTENAQKFSTNETHNETTSFQRIKALIGKNWIVSTRNILLLVFMMIVPATQVIMVCLSIGNDPKPMWMGVVNKDLVNGSCSQSVKWEGCDVENFSCKFLAKIPPDVIYFRHYDTQDEAREGVKAGHIWGFITFPDHFSGNLYERVASGSTIENETLQNSYALIEMDYSNKQIANVIKKEFYDAFKLFIKEVLEACGFYPELGDSPIKYLDSIYGSDDTDFREFIAPGILMALVFFFPVCSSGVSYIWDKKQGTLERVVVAGVTNFEVMTAFFVTECVVLLIQSGLSFSVILFLFEIEIKGSIFLAVLMTILMGLVGVSFGFLLASFCNEEIEAVMLAIASFMPNIILSGVIWPVEGLPKVMQYFTYFLPCKMTSDSIRSIVSRGWGFSHIGVWSGFVSCLIWIAVSWIITLFIHKYRYSKR